MPVDRKPDTPRRAPACPVCGKPRVKEHDPFCSRRCADIDLQRWLSGGYAIPATPADDDEADSFLQVGDGDED